MNYKCLIVANDVAVINILTKYVNSIDQIKISALCEDVPGALRVLAGESADLLFIHLKFSVEQIARDFLKFRPKVIVITDEQNFMVRANDLEAINHLMEPGPIQEFIKAMKRLWYLQEHVNHASTFVTPEYVYFRFQRKMIKVFLDDIAYIESSKDYIAVHTDRSPPLRLKQSISTLEAMLPRKRFLRIHRSFIVSVPKITAFTHYDVELGKTELPIGRKYRDVYDNLKNV